MTTTTPSAASASTSSTFVFPGSAPQQRIRKWSLDDAAGSGGGGSKSASATKISDTYNYTNENEIEGHQRHNNYHTKTTTTTTTTSPTGWDRHALSSSSNPLLRMRTPLATTVATPTNPSATPRTATTQTVSTPGSGAVPLSSSASPPPPSLWNTASSTSIMGVDGNSSTLRQRKSARVTTNTNTNTTNTSTTPTNPTNPSPSTTSSTSSLKQPPPKASLSLGTGSVTVETAATATASTTAASTTGTMFSTTTAALGTNGSTIHQNGATTAVNGSSTAGGWVLVYGYAAAYQYDELVRRFGEFGHVLQHRGSCRPGRSNWIALQYASPLQAAKALCHQHVQLQDGIFCGVKSLEDNDPILWQQQPNHRQHQQQYSSTNGVLWTASLSSPSQTKLTLNTEPTSNRDNRNITTSSLAGDCALNENDILLDGGSQGDTRYNYQHYRAVASKNATNVGGASFVPLPNRSLCEKLLRWLLSISD